MTHAHIIDVPQRTTEWFAARAGRLTASCVGDAFAVTKAKTWAASRRNLRLRLALERLTGKPSESEFVSPAMERGAAMEAEALAAYEALTGGLVESVGFIAHDTLLTGGSPDGLIDDGVVEIKCPSAAAHLDYIRGEFPAEYRLQVVHLLWLTGRLWGDLVSYHPDFPGALRLVRVRISAADVDMDAHDASVRLFLDEVDREYDALATLADPAGRLAAALET